MSTRKTITAAKLIEYAFATPQRRTKIIENAMEPPTYLVDTKYPDIERALAFFMQSGCSDPTRLNGLDDAYGKQQAKNDHHEQRLLTAHDAIAHALQMNWRLPPEANVEFLGSHPDSLEIAGLHIRIKPGVIFRQRMKGTKLQSIGAAKAYFGKTAPLSVKGKPEGESDCERGVLFATLLHWHIETNLSHLGKAEPSLCMVGDVFSEQVHFAAKRFIQRRKLIESIAQEISDRWEPIMRRLSRTELADKKLR